MVCLVSKRFLLLAAVVVVNWEDVESARIERAGGLCKLGAASGENRLEIQNEDIASVASATDDAAVDIASSSSTDDIASVSASSLSDVVTSIDDALVSSVPEWLAGEGLTEYCTAMHELKKYRSTPAWTAEDCKRHYESNEQTCQDAEAWERKNAEDGTKNGIVKARAAQLMMCPTHKALLAKIKHGLENRPTRRIKEATGICSKASKKVCIDSLCPTWNAIQETDEDCSKLCDATTNSMFALATLIPTDGCDGRPSGNATSGPVELTPEEVENCAAGLQRALKERNGGLEAMLREHFLKCTCVSWRTADSRSVCYGGSGIAAGDRWCDYKTPTWVKLLEDHEVKELKPECVEFPMVGA